MMLIQRFGVQKSADYHRLVTYCLQDLDTQVSLLTQVTMMVSAKTVWNMSYVSDQAVAIILCK